MHNHSRNSNRQPLKFAIFSDLHVDIMAKQRAREGKAPIELQIPEEAEVVILAGDIAEGMAGLEWAQKLGKTVIIIPGNHEYYWNQMPELERQMREYCQQAPNLIFLNNDRCDIQDVRILGTTLWTDYCLEGDSFRAMRAAKKLMSDHQVIFMPGDPIGLQPVFTPKDAREIHIQSRAWLEGELAKAHDGPTVVVTHHAPHMLSVHPMFHGRSPLNASFASDLSDILKRNEIDLWIHGHTHWTFDYEIHGTRVVCNPYGYYPTREINDFNPNLVMEIG